MDTISPYVLLAGFTFVEGGEVALLFAGYLMHTYGITLLPVTGVLIVAILAGDILWYSCGRYLYGLKVFSKMRPHLARIDNLIVRRPFMTALVARFTYGLHHFVIARYRDNGIRAAHMARILLATSAIWLVVLGGIVVLIVRVVPSVRHYVHFFELALAFCVVAFFLFERLSALFWRQTLSPIEHQQTVLNVLVGLQ
jgi:membrane protein DedA with SNARE-associated domain